MPRRISSPRMRNTFNAPALATAAKGTNLPSTTLAPGLTFNLGTSAFSPSATLQLADTAKAYDSAILDQERGVDLLAFALFMQTLRD